MNELIKKQLKMCRVATIPQFSDCDTVVSIEKVSNKRVNEYQVGNYYIIEIEDYILNPSPSFNLAENWNKGSVPKHKHYKCMVSQMVGKMIKIIGLGYDLEKEKDLSDTWEGWLPVQGFTIVREMK